MRMGRDYGMRRDGGLFWHWCQILFVCNTSGLMGSFRGNCGAIRPGSHRSLPPVGSRENESKPTIEERAPVRVNKDLGGFTRTKGEKKTEIKIGLCGKSGKNNSPDVIAVDLVHLCPFTRELCPYCDYSMDREQSPSAADARYVDVL